VLQLPPDALDILIEEPSVDAQEYLKAAVEFMEAFLVAMFTSPVIPSECATLLAFCLMYMPKPEPSDLDVRLDPLPPRPMLRIFCWGRDSQENMIQLPIRGTPVQHMLYVAPGWLRNGKRWDRDFWVMKDQTAVCDIEYMGTALPAKLSGGNVLLASVMVKDVHVAKTRAKAIWDYFYEEDLSLYRTAPASESSHWKP
jgi:hypothetical protein